MRRLKTVPARLRAAAVVSLVLIGALVVLSTLALDNARTGLNVIGHKTGPVVAATGDLYYALSDMDAQVSQVLLIGKEDSLGSGRAAALQRYEQRRAVADQEVLEAAKLTAADPAAQTTARDILQGLGRYEMLAAQALVLDEQSGHPAGPPPPQVLEVYRQATDLMKLELLPQAYNLTLTSATIVRHTYADEHSAVLAGRAEVLTAGGVLLALLVWLQLYLARIFRRVMNLALAFATVCVVGGVSAVALLLTYEANTLARAKHDGFDSVLALSRARSISNSANADQGRFLLDPARSDTAAQTYLDKSQAVLYVDAGRLEAYDAGVDAAIGTYLRTHRDPGFLGFLGQEARSRRSSALDRLLADYRQLQVDDAKIRQLVATGQAREAIEERMGPALSDAEQYDTAMMALIAMHGRIFDHAVHSGDRAVRGGRWPVPGAALGIAVLILAGLRPRIIEFRK